jgi:outer membrane protein assembly factor BamB
VVVRDWKNYRAYLYGLSRTSGRDVWKRLDLGSPFALDEFLVFYRGRVIVLDHEGVVWAIEGSSGRLIWKKQMPLELGEHKVWSFSGPLTVHEGRLYFAGAGFGGIAYSVSASTGEVLWMSPVNGGFSSPAVIATGVFYGFQCEQVDLDRSTGAEIWQREGPCYGGGGYVPIVHGASLYVQDGGRGNVILEAKSGRYLGVFSSDQDSPGYPQMPPAFAGSRGYFVSDGVLRSEDLSTRIVAWSFAGNRALASPPLVVNETVYVASKTGDVYGVRWGSGKRVWHVKLDPVSSSLPQRLYLQPLAAGGGTLVVPIGDKLTAFISA